MSTLKKWWYLPLIVMLGILVKAVVVAAMLTGMVKDAAVDALAETGLDDSVTYAGFDGVSGLGRDGLNVALEGPASAETAAVAALRARESINNVDYRVVEVESPVAVEAAVDDDVVEDDLSQTVTLKPIVVGLVGGSEVVLAGAVPDEVTRDALVVSATGQYGASSVTDNLTIEPEGLTVQGGTLVVSGEAVSAEEKAGWLAQAAPVAASGNLSLVDEVRVVATTIPIQDVVDALFALGPIEFDTRESVLRASSIATLEEAAETIIANPGAGRVLVVGHTDSEGRSEPNLRLSQARASAVVQYLIEVSGVDPARLESDGRGESELLVSPEESPADTQRNRRITWEATS